MTFICVQYMTSVSSILLRTLHVLTTLTVNFQAQTWELSAKQMNPLEPVKHPTLGMRHTQP